MTYCCYCNYNLDGGDIFIVLSEKYPHLTQVEVMKKAMLYGYTPENRRHFINMAMVYIDESLCYKTCIKCNGINPLR